MNWKIKDFIELHPQTQKNLAKTTPWWHGDYMQDACQFAHERPKGSYIVVAGYKGNTLVGWAMLDFFLSRSVGVRTYIYVKPKYRRNGYGSEILKKAKEKAKKMGRIIKVLPHNKTSTQFFKSMKINKSEVCHGYKGRYN
jgi:GNAT superfamily N-acetyltransferase